MQRLLDFFGSVRLTIGLLMVLSMVAIGGTIWPVEQTFGDGAPVRRFDLYYQAWWFRVLLGMLVVNLGVCTWHTIRRRLTEERRLLKALENVVENDGGVGCDLPPVEVEQLTARLGAAGYRVLSSGNRLLGRRHAAFRWAVPGLHLAVITIILGAFAGALGFVGTLNLYVTHQADSIHDWETQGQRPLDFTFRLDHFEPVYYPIDLQIAIIDPRQNRLLETITTREGETVAAGSGLVMRILRFYPEDEHLLLFLERDGRPIGEYHALSGKRDYPNNPDPGVLIKPAAYRDPVVKQLRSQVTILENGQEVRSAVIEVNTPLVHRGIAIYQTAYARDPNGFWFCGFQFSRDPGEPLVWGGSIALSLALLLVFAVRPKTVALVPHGSGWKLVPLGGFRGEGGRERLAALAGTLGRHPEESERGRS